LRRELADCRAEVEALRTRLDRLRSAGGDLLSDAAHAIRSPLTVTHSYLEIVCADLSEGLTEEQRSFLEIARENAVRLRDLVEDLVDLLALDSGIADVHLAPTDVGRIIDPILQELRPAAERKDLQVTTEIIEDLPAIVVDRKRLRDAIRRLVDNAIRFTPEAGCVVLRASREEGFITIEVIDDGIGIPTDRIDEVFRPFAQRCRRPAEDRESYGLGLPLCRRQVEACGGTLELTSTEGGGTTATISIPIADTEP
jgi:signal transduction histidine kinase